MVRVFGTADMHVVAVPDDADLSDPNVQFDALVRDLPLWARLLYGRRMRKAWLAGQDGATDEP